MIRQSLANGLGILSLGVVSALCVIGVIYIAVAQPAETTTKTYAPIVASPTTTPGGSQTPPTAVQPQATSTTTDKSSTALSVLATIASAAVGGIAGMLRLAPKRADQSGAEVAEG